MRTHFILVGLLYLCGLSFSQECRPQLLQNLDFPGADILSLYSPDADHCQHLCTQHSSCLFFSFIEPHCTTDNRYFFCFLKITASGEPNVQVAKQGLTSGYSLKPCNPDPRPCLPKVYHDVDFSSSDYRSFFTSDFEECQRACTNDPGCQFFTFLTCDFANGNFRYKCHLKFSWPIPAIQIINAAAGIVSGFSHRTQPRELFSTECKGKLFPNFDYPGNDFGVVPASSPEHCQTLCSAHPLCTHFAYVSNAFSCYLKKNEHEIVGKAVTGITSGFPERFCLLDNKWVKEPLEGINFPHSDIRSFVVGGAEECQRTCTQNPSCQFYSYVISQRLCYLKRVITMPTPSKVIKLSGAVSGFSLRNCQQNIF